MTIKADDVRTVQFDASEAGRALNRARWGRTRTDRLVTELRERRADLLPDQVETLRELVARAGNGKS
jgi:hypothetical protein